MNTLKSIVSSASILSLFFSISLSTFAETSRSSGEEEAAATTGTKIGESLKREALAAVQRSVNYLTDNQKSDGSWCGHPAITGLVCMALNNSNTKENIAIRKQAVEKGRQFMLKFLQPDGSIWMAGTEKEYPNYTTAIVLSALAIINDPNDEQVMRNARRYLLDSQLDEDNKAAPTKKDNPGYGGIGYGKSGISQPDLSNTQWALEALYLTEYLDKEPKAKSKEDTRKSDLAWGNAVLFLSRLQHVPESNDQAWVVKDKKDPNYGGFVYKSEESKASEKYSDKQTLRSYGSMTYAGLKSMIYAKLKKDDPRVKAAVEWAEKNYTLDENPGIGPEGHFYYIQTFAKTHSILGDEMIKTPDGKEHPWRIDLIKKLLSMQKGKGEWYNDQSGRWMESIPELVTAYTLLAMEAALGPELAK